jgi:hypothetical protein
MQISLWPTAGFPAALLASAIEVYISQPRAHAEKDTHCTNVRATKDQVVFQTTSSACESGIQEVHLSLPVKTWSLSHEEKVRRAEALSAMKVASAGFSYQSSNETSTYVS